MTDFSFTSPSPMTDELGNYSCGTLHSANSSWHYARNLELTGILSFMCVVCIFGLLGNGIVIWILGFHMKRNPITIYILNLAVADLGVLIVSVSTAVLNLIEIHSSVSLLVLHYLQWYLNEVAVRLFHFACCMSQFLVTAISIGRCVSATLPLWHRFHRPETLSTVLCALIWLLSSLIHGLDFILYYTPTIEYTAFLPEFCAILVNVVVCLPIITVSTLILFIRFCFFKTQQRQRGKLLMAIFLTLFFFLIFAFPLNAIYLIFFNPMKSHEDRLNIVCCNVLVYGWLCASLNSCVNPLLYFLVGRKKKDLCWENLKLILRRVFTEEEEVCADEPKIQ